MVSFSTTSHICIAVISILFILGQVAQCMSVTYTENDEFPIEDVTPEEADVWQRMALVILTRALETLSDKMADNQLPLEKRANNNSPNKQPTVRRAGNLFWRTGVLGRPGGHGGK